MPIASNGPSGAIDLSKYKGIYYGEDQKKYTDPVTGAHFEYNDFCRRLDNALRERIQRDMIEKEQLEHAADLKLRDSVEARAKSQAPPRQEELRTFHKPDVNPERLA